MRTVIIPLLVWTGFACSPLRDNESLLASIGDPCNELEDCGAGLVCSAEERCAPVGEPGTADIREPCAADDDCRISLVCGGAGRCARGRQGEVADPCNGDESCGEGLACNREGRCARDGEPGTIEEGGSCELTDECGYGMVCSAANTCTPVPIWAGVECENIDGAGRVLFEVPRGGRTTDFFRLPWPNDVARSGNAVDLDGYPGLEQFPEPGQAVGGVLAALEAEGAGFGLNSAVIFRFSRAVEFETLSFGGETQNFIFVDITPGSEARGRRPRARFFATTDRSRYICDNWLGIRPSEGTPLEPGHTYAVMFLEGVLDKNGVPLQADDDLITVMGPTRPRDPALSSAWERYLPLKTWLVEQGIAAQKVIGATVFTTDDPTRRMVAMKAAVEEGVEPELTRAASCDDAASPCGGAAGRGCGPRDPDFIEVHAVALLPRYLEGVPPFEFAGGQVQFENGRPKLQSQAEVCVAITIPRRERPVGGWPTAIFAHAVGGHFRTFIERGLAKSMAQKGYAVVSFDSVLQGRRNGQPEPLTPQIIEERFDDPYDPIFSRDHAFQAVADLFSLTRLLKRTRLRVGMADLGFNRERFTFIGHGRGGELGVPFAALETNLEAVVLSSAGGSVMDQLQLTLDPVNHGARFGVALAEPALNGMHPGLQLYQTWLDARDPMNFGPLLRSPPEELAPRHVLFVYGTADTITPGATMNFLATSARLSRVGPEREPLQAIQPVEDGPTANANVRVNGKSVTQAIKQYAPVRGDGHDVIFESPEVQSDLQRFFQALNDGAAPTISP
ncbi:MAG: hypothetical protein H6706_18145 [Myxococcales bacterium]|nr:hypothetical protein [Myxococcales bacterium]